MKKGLSEIVLVLDRSGSMTSTKADAEGGLRDFIEKQRVLPGECDVTFYRFDNEIERVFDKKPIQRVENVELSLDPRGSTALLDAMIRAVDEVGKRLSNTAENERPERVFVVTITDGYENSSKARYSDVAERIANQRDNYKWEFLFIGANQDAIATASKLNILPQYSLSYAPTADGTVNAYAAMTQSVSFTRQTGQSYCYTDDDRAKAMGKTSKTAK